MTLVWHGNRVEAELKKAIMAGIRQGAFVLEATIKGSMRKGGSTESGEIERYAAHTITKKGEVHMLKSKNYRDPKTGKEYGRKQSKIGRYHSQPGESPRVQTGTLRRSITHDFDDLSTKMVARVGTNVVYGKWLEFGIPGGKTITPKRAKRLRWFTPDGKAVFAMAVKQGAIKPRPFMRPAVQKTREFIGKIIGAAAAGQLGSVP